MSAENIDRGTALTLRVRTRFASIEELVPRFASFVDRESIFVATSIALPVGARRRFQVLLADQTVVLDGLGEVIAGDGVHAGRKGARLRIVELAPPTRPTFEKILAARHATRRDAPAPVRPDSTRTRRGPPPPFGKPGGRAAAVPPTPTPTPPPAVVEAPAPVAPPPPAPVPAPAAVAAPVAEPPAPLDDGPALSSPGKRRVRTALVVAAAILLVGIVASLSGGDDEPRRAEPAAGVAPPLAAARTGEAEAPPPAAVEPAAVEPAADEPPAAVETASEDATPPEPAAEPPRKRRSRARDAEDRRSSSRPPAASKREPARAASPRETTSSRPVRLTLKSKPPGATFRVNGETLRANETMVPSGTTVTVTATLRGYKRTTRSIEVRRGSSLVIQLERL